MKAARQCLFFVLLILPVLASAQETADGKQLYDRVRYLASDDLAGRRPGNPGYLQAASYVATSMELYGLRPALGDSAYYQEVDFPRWEQFDPPTRLEMTAPRKYSYIPGRGRDYSPVSGSGSGRCRGTAVFAGYGIISEKAGWDDYRNLDLNGRIVIILPGAPDSVQGISVSERSTSSKVKEIIKRGGAGLILINPGLDRRMSRGLRLNRDDTVPENFIILTVSPETADDIFYAGGSSWRWLTSMTLRKRKSFTKELDVTLEMEAHYRRGEIKAPNVLGVIPGTDAALSGEYIIVGGHLDHLGVGPGGQIYNGADDNAGSAAIILELARLLQANNFKPRRTILFASWAGEEMGLVGSRFYTNHPVFPLEKTAVYLNIDMAGSGDKDLFVGGMYSNSRLFGKIREHLSLEIVSRLRYRLDYGGSDHSSFLAKGVKALSLRTGDPLNGRLDDEHPEYHRPGDTIEIMDPEILREAADYYYQMLTYLDTTSVDLFAPEYQSEPVHKNSFVADLHCDTIGRVLQGEDLSQDLDHGHIDIPKLKRGAVDLQIFACYVGVPRNEEQKQQAAERAFRQIDAVHQLVEEHPDDLMLVKEFSDTYRLRGTGKIGAFISIEGGYAIEYDLRLLRSFYRCGVRLMTLTHWNRTSWADASGDSAALLGGLTKFGEDVVKEMNRLGMIIDVSHAHDSTFWDVMRVSKAPVVASHSCCRALSEHHRNLSDEMLKALAKNGGVVGINFLPSFLNSSNSRKLDSLRTALVNKYGLTREQLRARNSKDEKVAAFREEYNREREALMKTLPVVDVGTIVDHIDHVIKVTGSADYVGLGSDFDGISSTPQGLENAGKIEAITAELLKRGYAVRDIEKILGGNFLRVFREVERVARNTNAPEHQ